MLGEVKRLIVIDNPDEQNNSFMLNLECTNLAFCGNGNVKAGEDCKVGSEGLCGIDFCNVNTCECEDE
ncbi:MAG: hypothetical protein GWO07_03045 [Candidatus Dadabacteria bacterium]|nr:hypothetical protein [Candidatus Dadabacteria bacterium]NIS07743.1 hypothetical protein [Candidatus Dadabacteria bacterium]NIV40982.1 hypothetical protein [Candidatus Dadabacteria bacterium]NIX14395.1 hypothetical protein [Candidatus Dadabacteria bacterium]NIY20907.1 hypothetical protein [Candidatus Dadabacteria bacterium]